MGQSSGKADHHRQGQAQQKPSAIAMPEVIHFLTHNATSMLFLFAASCGACVALRDAAARRFFRGRVAIIQKMPKPLTPITAMQTMAMPTVS